MAEQDLNCVFCKIVAGQVPSQKVHEDGEFLAIKDIQPITEGHTVVLSKKHYVDPQEMPATQRGNLFNTAFAVAAKIVVEVGADGYNLLVCSNEAAESSVPHRPHIHVIPRKTGDHLQIDPRT